MNAGGSVVVASEGTGEPVVFLHGLGSWGRAWAPVVHRLRHDYRCIVLDLPGHGAAATMREWSVEAYCAAVLTTLTELGLDRPHVAGNSLGGAIALELAKRNAVRSATAIAPIGFWSRPEIGFCRASLLLQRRLARLFVPIRRYLARPRLMRSLLFWPMMARPGRLDAEAAEDAMYQLARSPAVPLTLPWTRHYRFRPAPVVHPPVSIAWGTIDLLLPRWQQDRAQLLLPEAAYIRLPGCGHVPMSDDPDLVARTIADTCRKAAAREDRSRLDRKRTAERGDHDEQGDRG